MTPMMKLATAALKVPELQQMAKSAIAWEQSRAEVERWRRSGDTGTSSEYLCAVLSGGRRPANIERPHDNGDFGRCVRMLRAIPRLRSRLDIMLLGHGGAWRALVTHWDELEALYDAKSKNKLYDRIRELVEPHDRDEGWVTFSTPTGESAKARPEEAT